MKPALVTDLLWHPVKSAVCLFRRFRLLHFPPQVVTGTQQLLIAEGLSNTFDGERFQFEDIALTVCKGQKLGLVGINGCGKSTLLKVRLCCPSQPKVRSMPG